MGPPTDPTARIRQRLTNGQYAPQTALDIGQLLIRITQLEAETQQARADVKTIGEAATKRIQELTRTTDARLADAWDEGHEDGAWNHANQTRIERGIEAPITNPYRRNYQ